jgi:plastocyanin
MIKQLLALITFLVATTALSAQTIINISDSDIQPGQTVNWTNNNVYLLNGLVFVEEGAVLNIQAGTVVKFTPLAEINNPSALIITRGAKIFAEGTAAEPIIFTAEEDDVNDPNDLGPKDNALWGGIVILGNGITEKQGNSIVSIEGIPTTELRGLYGGTNNADNSGVLKYVSIRHGGRQLVPGSELNGLTLGAVGSGTVLDYVEVYANSDDGIEFFGGAPNLKHAVVAFAEDDSYDWDEVYTGKGQFWFSIQRDDIADAGGELDGSTPDDDSPYSNPVVYNWTHIGSGAAATAANPIGWNLRAGTAGTIANSILTEQKGKLIEVQDKAAGIADAYAKLATGELKILNNVFFRPGVASGFDVSSTGIIRVGSAAEDATAAALISHLTTNNNLVSDPQINGISREANGLLDPRPAGNSAINTGLAAYPANDPFFTQVNYKGAFPSFAAGLWVEGWTALDRNGHLVDLSQPNVVNINDASILPCQNITWTKDNTYIVDGLTFVDSCATLTIEAGTVVKFTPRADVSNPSALIVAADAKLFAEGTAAEPIIFTAEEDDVNDPNDLGPKDNALWGGIVILGNGITEKQGNSIVSIEGIPTTELRGLYGGTNNADNSGVLKYVSIRHGGRQLVPGSELNGLTLGAVGSGTVLDYVEVYANSDDGIEFFGGAPNLKHAVVAFAEDDSYDWDEVYTGKGQFWFSIQRDDIADAGGELDGSTPDDDSPFSNPTVYNWTHIGSGANATANNPIGWNIRAGTAGTIANSILTEQKGKLIEVQDKAAGIADAYAKLATGELKILNNLFFRPGVTAGFDATTTGIIRVGSAAEDANATALVTHLTTNLNKISDPEINGISREQNEQLDPRPCDGFAYFDNAALPAGDAFFTQVDFKGAFGKEWDNLWIRNWTALDRNNHLVNAPGACNPVNVNDAQAIANAIRIMPNPAQDVFVLESTYDGILNVEIFDLAGRAVANHFNLAGPSAQTIQIAALPQGMYVVKVRNEAGAVTALKLIVE